MVTAETLRALAQKCGPYLLLEMLLPGGSLVALSLFLYRRYNSSLAPIAIAEERSSDAPHVERSQTFPEDAPSPRTQGASASR